MARGMSKSEFMAAIADKTGLTKKQVGEALEAMNNVIIQQLGKKGPGEVTIPGLLKLNVAIRPAVPARDGVNPFTKQPTVFKARPVKALKDAV